MTLAPHRQPIDAPAPRRVIATFNAYHLGDNLLTLHYLRALAKAYPEIHFEHSFHQQYLSQLAPLVTDLPNLRFGYLSCAQNSPRALDTWLGAGGWFYAQPDKHDFVAIYHRHFANLSRALGLACPFAGANPRDLLFDYPALKALTGKLPDVIKRILVINSPPQSGQFPAYDPAAFDRIIRSLTDAGHIVFTTAPSPCATFCTQDLQMDVTEIGRLSQDANAIIGVPTGPMWPTFNIWNADTIKLRLLLLATERVEILPRHTVHANHLSLVPEILKNHGLL